MLLSVVTFVISLVLIQGLYAAPIGESVGTSNPNENYLSNTTSTRAIIGASRNDHHFVNLLNGTAKQVSVLKKHCNPLNSKVDTPQSSNNVSFQCCWKTCNQSFDSVTELSKHIQSHIVKRQKYYKCKWENCNYGCYKISDLQKHLRKHTKERPFVCQCGKSFDRNENLKKHIETIHSSKVQKITHLVQECESLELDKNEVQQQALLHCDWKNCNREFNDVTLLSEHIEKYHIGSGKSRYECQWKDCDYATSFRSNIEKHIRTHTKEKPFICSYSGCGKSFTGNSALDQHMNVHLSNSYFACPLLDCDKKYTRIDQTRRHFHVHAAASMNLSISDVDSIWNAFRKKIPYPADILNRIKLKERIIEKNKQESDIATIESESNRKKMDGNENYSEISVNETECYPERNEIHISDSYCDTILPKVNETEVNIYNLESNEYCMADADLDLIFSEVIAVDESVSNVNVLNDLGEDKNMEAAANDVTECISFTELDKDGSDCAKRLFDFDNEFDYVSKKIKSSHLTDNDNSMDCDFSNSLLEQNDNSHQNLQSLFSPLSLEQLLHSELMQNIFLDSI